MTEQNAAVKSTWSDVPSRSSLHLSHEQIAHYDRHGYLLVEDMFSPKEIRLLKSGVPELVEERCRAHRARGLGRDRPLVYSIHRSSRMFAHLARHPRIVEPARHLLDSDVYVYQSKLNTKAIFDGDAWPWHQDYIYWLEEDGMPAPRALTAAVYLDDVTELNGPMMVIPGSNHEGLLGFDSYQGKPSGYEDAPGWIANVVAKLKYTIDKQDLHLDRARQRRGLGQGPGRLGAVLRLQPGPRVIAEPVAVRADPGAVHVQPLRQRPAGSRAASARVPGRARHPCRWFPRPTTCCAPRSAAGVTPVTGTTLRAVARSLRPSPVRAAGRADARPDRGGLRRSLADLPRARLPRQPPGRPAAPLGVGPDELVGLCVERSLEMVVGLLGDPQGRRRLRAARPGVPARSARLDASRTPARRCWSPSAHLAEVAARAAGAGRSCLDDDGRRRAAPAAAADEPARQVDAEHLAYVIYTSGSTGKPKGVVVDARARSTCCSSARSDGGCARRGRCQLARLGFDASVRARCSRRGARAAPSSCITEATRRDVLALTRLIARATRFDRHPAGP